MDVPWRREFDAARDPYTARIALGITTTGGGGSFQPEDADLTSIAGYGGTGTWLYRSAADTWSPVTFGTGISFSGGTLSSTISTAGLAPINSPVFTGDPTAPTPATADNDTSIATTAFVKAQGYVTSATATASFQPLDADLTALAGIAGVQGDIIYRDASTWTRLAAGTSGQFLQTLGSGANPQWATLAGGGDVFQAGNNTFTGQNFFNLGSNLPVVVGHTARIDTANSPLEIQRASISLIHHAAWHNSAGNSPYFNFNKSRGGSIGTHVVVQSGDTLGAFQFCGSTGSIFSTAALIQSKVDSAPSTSVPGNLEFLTRTPGAGNVVRLTLSSSGAVTLWQSPAANDNSTAVATTAWVQGVVPSGAWTAWTPTISASAGTITSSTVNNARYTKAGKTITAFFDVTITNAGTGAGFLFITPPVAISASGGGAISGREVAITSVIIGGAILPGATVLPVIKYDGTTLVVTNYRIVGIAIYESA